MGFGGAAPTRSGLRTQPPRCSRFEGPALQGSGCPGRAPPRMRCDRRGTAPRDIFGGSRGQRPTGSLNYSVNRGKVYSIAMDKCTKKGKKRRGSKVASKLAEVALIGTKVFFDTDSYGQADGDGSVTWRSPSCSPSWSPSWSPNWYPYTGLSL